MRRRTIALIWTAAPVAAILVWLAAGARSTTRIVERPVRGSKVAPAPTNGVPAAAVGPAVADEQRPSWMLHGGPRHLGRSSYAGPGAPHVIWSYSTGGRISTQPVVDRLGNVYFGAHDSFFYSLAPNGSLRWRLPAGDRIYSTAAIGADGTIYFGSDADRFFAVRPDGSLRFSLRTESDADTSPVIAPNGSLYFAAGTDLYAVSPGGAVRWRLRAGGKIFSSPALGADGTLYFGCQDDQLYAVQPDGKLRWTYRTGADNDAAPAIGEDGTIFFGSDTGRLYALRPDGSLRWSADLGGYVRAPIAIGRDGTVIAGSYGPRPKLFGLDAATGRERFAFALEPTDSREVGIHSGAIIDSRGAIYFGAQDDYVYCLNPNGSLRWVHPTGDDVDSTPALGPDGTLYIGSDDHRLYAIR